MSRKNIIFLICLLIMTYFVYCHNLYGTPKNKSAHRNIHMFIQRKRYLQQSLTYLEPNIEAMQTHTKDKI